MTQNYKLFLSKLTKSQWERIGTHRRSGVVAPLFSLYSKKSIGIGEFPDLKVLIDWCAETKMSIIQFLPMNDVGFNFTPYDAQSSFALEPMYLCLAELKHVPSSLSEIEVNGLKKEFPKIKNCVDYGIKKAKLRALFNIFQKIEIGGLQNYHQFIQKNNYWIEDYAIFKVLKENHHEAGWQDWGPAYEQREGEALNRFKKSNTIKIEFWKWLQWQAYEQFIEAKNYAAQKSVLFMGDLPFLVSRDSADVWAHQDYFKMDWSSGAPPDDYCPHGQNWGMPPADWNQIASHDYEYLIQKLRYAENFYDLYRVDHVVGAFRIWMTPYDGQGVGQFDPCDESLWREHGHQLLSVMAKNTKMLPCGEDLGVIPQCTFEVLEQLGIPGMDVQRWMRDWEAGGCFKSPQDYRPHSIVIVATHDMSSLVGWWKYEIETVEAVSMQMLFESKGISFDTMKAKVFDLENSHYLRLRWNPSIKSRGELANILNRPEHEIGLILEAFENTFDEKQQFWEDMQLKGSYRDLELPQIVKSVLQRAQEAASIFSIQLLQDWLSLDPKWLKDPWSYRINFPGSQGAHNWSLVMPYSLEEMLRLSINKDIKTLNLDSLRT